MITLVKQHPGTSRWQPFERGAITTASPEAVQVSVADAAGWTYVERPIRVGRAVRFEARGQAGLQRVRLFEDNGDPIAETTFVLAPRTRLGCDRGPYGELADRLERMLARNDESKPLVIRGRAHRMFVPWGRDHVQTLKAMKYFAPDPPPGRQRMMAILPGTM